MSDTNTTYFTDAAGRLIALQPLANNRGTTQLRAEDLKRCGAAGCGPPWFWNTNGHGRGYVRTRNPGTQRNTVIAARLIAGAGPGEVVHYCDGDRLNLLPENLRIGDGRAKKDHGAFMDAAGDRTAG
jgi:hypothetical protein